MRALAGVVVRNEVGLRSNQMMSWHMSIAITQGFDVAQDSSLVQMSL